MAIGVEYQIKLQDKFSGKLSKAFQNVDKFDKKVSKLDRGIGKIGKALAGLGLGFAAFNILKGAGDTIIEFDDRIADLGAILGKTGTELDFFKSKAIELSDESTKSANDVVDAFKLVGSAKPELLKNQQALASVTKEAITLSEAARIDLPEAAQSLAGALNQFNLPASEAGRLINVLAAGSKEGAAAIPDISSAIDRFGTVAASANLSVEQSVGLVETLAEKNIKGAEAGTQLRNIILKLQQANFGFKNGVFSLSRALDEVNKKNLTAVERTKLFGLESVTAGNIILDNTTAVERYTKAVTGTNTANEQAAQNSNTLRAKIDDLGKSWDNLVLSVNEGNGVISSAFEGGVSAAQNFLDLLRDINSETVLSRFEELGLKLTSIINPLARVRLATETRIAKAVKQQQEAAFVFGGAKTQLPGMGSIFDELGGTPTDKDGDPLTPGGKKGKGLKTGISEVKAGAPKTFNINIEKLVDEFKVQTTNMEQAPSRVKDMVQQALLTALADLSIQSE